MSEKVECAICGGRFWRIGNHLPKHNISVIEYTERYPGREMTGYRHTKSTREKMSGPRKKGIPKSPEHRKKLSEARKGKKYKPHSPETIQKMRDAWDRRKQDRETYDKYTAAVSARMKTPEMLVVLRDRFAELIREGNHNGKSSGTTLERKMESYLQASEVIYERQKIVNTANGSFVFDFYLPDTTLLIEVDGEYWHRKSLMQFNRDKLKERLCREMGYRFVRISDLDWKPNIIHADDGTMVIHNASIMAIRELYLMPTNSVDLASNK